MSNLLTEIDARMIAQSDQQRVTKPWGEEIIFADCEDYAGKILRILPGHRTSIHMHENKDETIYVLDGLLDVEAFRIDSIARTVYVTTLGPGQSVRVLPGVWHRLTGMSTRDTLAIESSTARDEDGTVRRDPGGPCPAPEIYAGD